MGVRSDSVDLIAFNQGTCEPQYQCVFTPDGFWLRRVIVNIVAFSLEKKREGKLMETSTPQEAYGKSRGELLSWLNSVVPSGLHQSIGGEIVKVEQCGSGIPYLYIVPRLFPQSPSALAAPAKVKFPARQEYEASANLKLLQEVFTKNQVEPRSLDVDKLSKRNFQANLEFLQWFKRLCDTRGLADPSAVAPDGGAAPPSSGLVSAGAGSGGGALVSASAGVSRGPPSANVARPLSAGGSPAGQSPGSRKPSGTVSAGRAPQRLFLHSGAVVPAASGPTSSRTAGGASSNGQSGGLVASRGGSSTDLTRRPLSSPSAQRSKSPVGPNAASLLRSTRPTVTSALTTSSGRSTTPTRASASATVMRSSSSRAAAAAVADETLSAVDRERRFYYDKLRRIEELVRQPAADGHDLAAQIQKILMAPN